MGIWEQTTLDNDTAADFLGSLPRWRSWATLADTLARALTTTDSDGLLEGLAACEVVAAALGRPTAAGFAGNREAMARWVKRNPLPPGTLLQGLACSVASRFTADTDPAPYHTPWSDGSPASWAETYDDLRARLAYHPGDPGITSPVSHEDFLASWLSLAELSHSAAAAVLQVSGPLARTMVTPAVVEASLSGQSLAIALAALAEP